MISLGSVAQVGSAVAERLLRLSRTCPWIRAINTNYHVGVDGLSFWLVMLTTFIMPIAVLSTWHAVEKRRTAFYVFLLLLEIGDDRRFCLARPAGLLSVFRSVAGADVLPDRHLGRRKPHLRGVKFFIFTAFGSLLMLVAIIALYYMYADQTGLGGTFDFVALLNAMKTGTARDRTADRHAAVLCVRACVCDQGAAVPVPHVAARRTYRGSDGRFRDPGRRAAEDGNVRPDAVQFRVVSGRRLASGRGCSSFSRSSASSTALSSRWCSPT